MKFDFQIRTAAVTDVAQIVTLMEQYWTFEGIAGFESERMAMLVKQVLSNAHLGTIWIARAADEILGYLVAVFVFSFEYNGLVAEIDELFVLPQARSHGIGGALLNTAESCLAEHGCTRVQLQLGEFNRGACDFYQRRAFAERTGYALLDKRLGGA